jgi:hypothetical protein
MSGPRRIFWLLQTTAWVAAIPAFITLNLVVGMPVEVSVFNGVFRQLIGFILTTALAEMLQHWSWERRRYSIVRRGGEAILITLGATIVDMLCTSGVHALLGIDLGSISFFDLTLAAGIGRFLLYGTWMALYILLCHHFELRARDLAVAWSQTAARTAELHALRAQINPHFLFNTLNSILAEADDNPAGVKSLTSNLSEMLRYTLRQRHHMGMLGDEADAIESYLRVESVRFEDRLEWQVEVDDAARSAKAPSSLLLALVENALKYGFRTSASPLKLRVTAAVQGDELHALVENSGEWLPPDSPKPDSYGLGLSNLRRRLALLYGDQAQLTIETPPGWVKIHVQLPLQSPHA